MPLTESVRRSVRDARPRSRWSPELSAARDAAAGRGGLRRRGGGRRCRGSVTWGAAPLPRCRLARRRIARPFRAGGRAGVGALATTPACGL